MLSKKNAGARGTRQPSMPGPNSAAYQKLLATKAGPVAGKREAAKSRTKGRNAGQAFSSLKSRQAVAERAKRDIWASVLRINDALIKLAMCGNAGVAKALFDFAGVYSLPEAAGQPSTASADAAVESPGAIPNDPEDAFFRSIGIERATNEPELGPQAKPNVIASSL